MNIFLWSNTERWKFQEKIIEVYYFLIQNAIYLKVSDFSYITNNLLIVYLSIKRTLKNYNKKSVTTLCIMLIIKPISKCSKCLAISGVRLQNIFKLRNVINHTFHPQPGRNSDKPVKETLNTWIQFNISVATLFM